MSNLPSPVDRIKAYTQAQPCSSIREELVRKAVVNIRLREKQQSPLRALPERLGR